LIHLVRRLRENLHADRRRPPHVRLAALDDPERFVWAILPYAARSFSFCIALLPRHTARPLAVAYLYCRMLDTCEDLPKSGDEKEAKLAVFRARFDAPLAGMAKSFAAPPAIDAGCARDDADRTYLLLLEQAPRVDRLFLALPAAQQAVIVRLVRRMADGMIWAVRTFAAQGGALASDEQLTDYCFGVLGNPILFADEMQRLACGLEPEVDGPRRELAGRVGEAIQLANVARDLEKDCAAGVFYLPELKHAGAGDLSAAIAAARRKLLLRALELGRAFRPFLAGIPSPRISFARGAALLMELFTLAFWQGTAQRLGVDSPRRDRITPARSALLVARGVFSRHGFTDVLVRLDRVFAEQAERVSRGSAAAQPAEEK
jgi:phytoene/squalene synthetase